VPSERGFTDEKFYRFRLKATSGNFYRFRLKAGFGKFLPISALGCFRKDILNRGSGKAPESGHGFYHLYAREARDPAGIAGLSVGGAYGAGFGSRAKTQGRKEQQQKPEQTAEDTPR
jgi:hypothetical protein